MLAPVAQYGFDDALRKFLLTFKLPGEAQKIDRFMGAFAKQYHANNPTAFGNQVWAPDSSMLELLSPIATAACSNCSHVSPKR